MVIFQSFENKGSEVLNDVDALAHGEKGRGTSVKIEKKRAMDDLERELLSNKKHEAVQCVNDTPISTPASANISNSNSINSTFLELEKGKGKEKVISKGDNFANEKNPVNHDKDIGVSSKKKVHYTPQSYQNAFPSNVKGLLSSGLLDGVPVKYISVSWEKTLTGVIEGNGYLCSCNICKLSEKKNYLSASEFERHATCKSCHANNHIYFESGKTIHAVLQELKKTPQEMLYKVVQNIVGSPIHPKNFQTFNEYLEDAIEYQLAKNETAKPF